MKTSIQIITSRRHVKVKKNNLDSGWVTYFTDTSHFYRLQQNENTKYF